MDDINLNYSDGSPVATEQRDKHSGSKLDFGSGRDLESRLTKHQATEDEKFTGETNNGVRVDIDTGDLGVEA